ncbi:putative ABC transport system permease protein [Clostridium cadaveris]|uniref:Putative ABC transport system permease protein n=2 Tax=Clostridium cadaveris TaxID=1529 RepID=A0A1I2LPQ1_9CLOT|nr:ABC transporter permease [Clostridium cadaveris]MDM8310959.1 ABC transporter permease [Clostridium cadaveris]NWK10016.1 ABC transporter permease [Clostridium cadaveris]SFF81073.1 putative ABC transport system permease protein [Clostridium cadaveris]
MNKFFYPKLAATTIKKNGKVYIPYILTCIGSIAMFYIIHSISINTGLDIMNGGKQLKMLLNLGKWVIGIFSVIFLLYTNSFLIKRRKKELGLYNILGMEKKHISKLMLYETLIIAVLTLVSGIAIGALLSKFMFLLLLKILNFDVTLKFYISKESILSTMLLFISIYAVMLLNNLRQIHLSNPVELLKGGNAGEREPKTKWILTLIGVVSLGAGYYIAVTTENPLSALNLFFIAVLLVIVGTYALFTAGSIAILKALKKNKNFYYKSRNFINVSNMIYRMKQNAVGLANICILSTAILVVLSTTVSLYIGMDDILKTRYPDDIMISISEVQPENIEKVNSIIETEMQKSGLTKTGALKHGYISEISMQEDNKFIVANREESSITNMNILLFITADDYNQLEGKSVQLEQGEVLICADNNTLQGNSVEIFNKQFNIKGYIEDLKIKREMENIVNGYYIIVSDIDSINEIKVAAGDEEKGINYYYGLDVEGSMEEQLELTNAIQSSLNNNSIKSSVEGIATARESFFSIYGGLFFIGLFLGLLFIMATVLIIYYKQISEGYDDKERFEIMQKVGMDKREVKKSINSQILMVFFLPLVMAVIHLAFAFKIITSLLKIFNLTNINLFVICTTSTILVFAIFYIVVYYATSKVYYRIVQ